MRDFVIVGDDNGVVSLKIERRNFEDNFLNKNMLLEKVKEVLKGKFFLFFLNLINFQKYNIFKDFFQEVYKSVSIILV